MIPGMWFLSLPHSTDANRCHVRAIGHAMGGDACRLTYAGMMPLAAMLSGATEVCENCQVQWEARALAIPEMSPGLAHQPGTCLNCFNCV